MLKERRILKYTSHEAIKVAKQMIESLGGVNRVEWVIINTPHSMQGKDPKEMSWDEFPLRILAKDLEENSHVIYVPMVSTGYKGSGSTNMKNILKYCEVEQMPNVFEENFIVQWIHCVHNNKAFK